MRYQSRVPEGLAEHAKLFVQEFQPAEVGDAKGVALSFAFDNTGQHVHWRVEIGPRVAASLKEAVQKFVAEKQTDIIGGDIQVLPYDPSAQLEDHEIEILSLKAREDVLTRLVPLRHPKQLEAMRESEMRHASPRYFVVSIQRPDLKWMHFCKLMTVGSQPQRTKLAIIKGHDGSYFDKLSDPMYVLDPRDFDFCWHEPNLFVINKTNFRNALDLDALACEEVANVLASIGSKLPFCNESAFLEACRADSRMAAKVARMKGLPHLEYLSIERAKEAKERFDLHIEFERRADGTEALRFIARYKWEYAKILGDEYLNSPITDLDYEVSSKRLIRKQPASRRGRAATEGDAIERAKVLQEGKPASVLTIARQAS